MKISKKTIFFIAILILVVFLVFRHPQEAKAGFLDDALSTIGEFLNNVFTAIFKPVLTVLANLLPQSNSISTLSSSVASVMIVGYQFSFIIPWQQLFTCLSVVALVELSLILIKFITWIIRLARG